MRETEGEQQLGNHVCLLAELDLPYIADVGFGGSLSEPLPLRTGLREDPLYRPNCTNRRRLLEILGAHRRPAFQFRLSRRAGRSKRCSPSNAAPSRPTRLAIHSEPRRATAHRFDTHVSLRGRVLTITHAGGREDKTVLEFPGELVTTLRSRLISSSGSGDVVARHLRPPRRGLLQTAKGRLG